MVFSLPPSIRADLTELRRGGLPSLSASLTTPILTVLVCAGLVSIPFYVNTAWAVYAGAVLAIIGSYTAVHGRVSDVRLRACTGWCGALQLKRGAVTRACAALAGVALFAAMSVGTLLVAIASVWASRAADVASALIAMDGGLVAGTVAALLRVTISGGRRPPAHGESIRDPLFGLDWLDYRGLPHVMDWQRRAALIPWRRGSSLIIVLPFLRLGPGDASVTSVVVPALLLGSIVWFALVMRESARVAGSASNLLASTPVTAKQWRASALRYPLIAATCTAAWAIVSVVLAHSLFPLIASFACALETAIAPAVSIARRVRAGTPR